MAKITPLNEIASLANTSSAKAALNDNFDRIEEAFENTLSRDGSTPNQMEADLDMNSNDILNAGIVDAESFHINGVPFEQSVAYGDKLFELFNGTGVQTAFILQIDPGSLGNLYVSVDGADLKPGVDYNYSGTTLTFVVPPAIGSGNVYVRYDRAVPLGVTSADATSYTRPSTGIFSTVKAFLDQLDAGLADTLRGELADPASSFGGDLVAYTPVSTGVLGTIKSFLDALWVAGANTGAALIRFIQSGTGATARTVQAKQRETVSVLDYGADPTNTVDSSPAFQAAIDYVLSLADGGRVYVPPGRYRLLSQVQIPVSSGRGKLIYGDGAASVIVTSLVGGGLHAFYVGAGVASGNINTHFESLRFDGALGAGKAVKLEHANTCKFTNCHFIDMEQGVSMTESYAVRFIGCIFKAISQYGVVTTTSAHHTTFNNCNFYDCGAGVAFGTAVQIALPSDNIVFRDCDFEGNRRLLVCDGGSSFVYDGCYIENGLTSLVDVSGATKINGLSIRNCWISNNPAFAFNNVDGGELCFNKINAQTITFNTATVANFQVGNNFLVTSTVASPPFFAVTSFLNGYTGSNVGYKRYADGTVELSGTLILGANNTAAFALPAEFRPKITPRLTVSSSTATIGTLLIDSANGNVVPNTAGADVVLNGIRFST